MNDRWAFIRREDDTETFIAAVINIKAEDMKTILTCEDHRKPKDKDEAHVLACANLYAGLPPSGEIYAALGNTLPSNPARRRLYTNLPWCEKKNSALQFAVAHDEDLNLIGPNNQYRSGSLSHPSDHTDNAQRAGRCGIPMAGIVPEELSDIVALQEAIDRLQDELKDERKERKAAETDLMEATKRRRVAEMDLEAEKCRFKNEEVRCKQLEQRLADEERANKRLRRSLRGADNHVVSPPGPSRTLDQEFEEEE